MAKQTAAVVRMPQQHVRAGRGIPGYKESDEARVEVFKTPKPDSLPVTSTSTGGNSRKSKADLEADLRELGIEPEEGDTIKTLREKIAAAQDGA